MNISIVTIHNSSNYGAMLQTFALQEYISDLNHEVKLINYDNRFMSKGLDWIRHGLNPLEMYYFILDIKNFFKRKKMILNFKQFSKKYLKLDTLRSRQELMDASYSGSDIYISGSDQIWNPNVTGGSLDPVYFCEMVQKNSKIISYASSLGGYDFQDNKINELLALYLKKYDAIATREENYIPMLEQLINKKITKVMDPVFLLSDKEWEEKLKISRVNNKKPYVLIYAMTAHKKIIKMVKAAYLGSDYDIYIINQPLLKQKGIKYVVDAGPKEFVELFMNATDIVTNSFHGTALGLIFNKNIKVVANAKNMNRIYDLLNSIDASNILISEREKIQLDNKMDYNIINEKLTNLIDESKQYLKRELT